MQSSDTRTTSAAGLMDLLLRSGEALRNWRALVTLMGTGVTAIVMFMALAASGNGFLIFLGALLAYFIVSVGISATGILLMDQALGLAPRRIGAALVDGLFAAFRLFVIMLIGFVVALAVILVVAILVVICKIPGLGGFLYALVLPTCALVVAFVYAGLYFVMSLAGSSVWSGSSIRQAVSALYVIISKRLVESALGVIVHSILMAMIGGIVMLFVFAGTGMVLGLSAGILGSSTNIPNMSMLFGGFHGDSIVYGGLFGFSILVALVGAALFSMLILGLNRLYLHLTSDLDLAGAEAVLASRMDAATERARAMQEEARRRTEEMRQRMQQQQAAAAAPASAPLAVAADIGASQLLATAVPVCPACSGSIAAGDKFCEHCGHKLS